MAAVFLLLCTLNAHAQTLRFDLPSRDLAVALEAYARIAGVQLQYSPALVQGLDSTSLSGDYDADAALARLLQGTGLTYRHTAAGTITLELPAQAARSFGTVRVAGSRHPRGANGSRDVFATEGSDGYAALGAGVGSPTPQLLHDTPRTISVLGQPQIQDLGVIDLAEATRLLPGVVAADYASRETVPTVRGHDVVRYQLDGGAPARNIGRIARLRGDLTAYDRVELLRGADGLGSGYVAPGGILNFVRKRPLDRPQFVAQAQAGSWDNYRGMLDVTGPLAFDGRLRGRAVVAGVDQQHFQKRTFTQRQSYYGVLEADLTASTLLTTGVHDLHQDATPFTSFWLPAYAGLGQIGLPRRTSFALPWHRDHERQQQAFLILNQSLGADWRARLVLDREHNDSEILLSAPDGLLDADTGQGVVLFNLSGAETRREHREKLELDGRFRSLGFEQQVSFTLHSTTTRGTNRVTLAEPASYPLDVFDFDPAAYPRPVIPDDTDDPESNHNYGGSAALSLPAWAPLKMIGAWRWTANSSGGGAPRERYDGPSYLGLRLALGEQWNAYGNWARVYVSNFGLTTADGEAIEPTFGDSYEAGLKFTSVDGRLNATLALYRIELDNFARRVGSLPDVGPSCCYDNGSDERRISKGFDAEISGAVLPGVELVASYNYSRNRYAGEDRLDPASRFDSDTPKHLLKLWGLWRPAAVAPLRLGVGVHAQSRSAFITEPGETGDINHSQASYAVLNALVGWQIDPHWQASLQVNNLLDRVYYANADFVFNNANLYGAPRNLMLTLRATY